MYIINEELYFPDPSVADEDGLLAVGGDLSTQRLLLAYHSGIFPWFNQGQPPLWWSPDPRMILLPQDIYISKSMRKVLRAATFTITHNTAFNDVILKCQQIKRAGQDGTWITDQMVASYIQLHEEGHANSVEVWQENQLVGGLYGIDLKEKKVFCGESMFATVSNASKVGFIALAKKLAQEHYQCIDCQMYTDHLKSLGAQEIPRKEFLKLLN